MSYPEDLEKKSPAVDEDESGDEIYQGCPVESEAEEEDREEVFV